MTYIDEILQQFLNGLCYAFRIVLLGYSQRPPAQAGSMNNAQVDQTQPPVFGLTGLR